MYRRFLPSERVVVVEPLEIIQREVSVSLTGLFSDPSRRPTGTILHCDSSMVIVMMDRGPRITLPRKTAERIFVRQGSDA